jgi:hypothetical protein
LRAKRQFLPKRARYPLFLLGLAIMILGGLYANSQKSPAADIAGVVGVGFAFLIASVALS